MAVILLLSPSAAVSQSPCDCTIEVDGFGPNGNLAPRPVTGDTTLSLGVTVRNLGTWTNGAECDYEFDMGGTGITPPGTSGWVVTPQATQFTLPMGGETSFLLEVEIGEHLAQQGHHPSNNVVGGWVAGGATRYRVPDVVDIPMTTQCTAMETTPPAGQADPVIYV